MSGSGDPGGPEITPENIAAGGRCRSSGSSSTIPPFAAPTRRIRQATFDRAQATDPALATASYEAIPPTDARSARGAVGRGARPPRADRPAFMEDGMVIDVPGVGRCYIK